jgi:hypothetical protein
MKYLIFLPITLLSFGVAFGDYQPGESGDIPHANDSGGSGDPNYRLTGGPSDGGVGDRCLGTSCNLD